MGSNHLRKFQISSLVFIVMFTIFLRLPVNAITLDSDQSSVDGRVLLISAYHPGFQTFFQQVDGIRSVINGNNISLDIEFMDTKRFYSDTHLNQFYQYLASKLNQLPSYDVIIVADDNALNFALNHKDELFPNTPIVFLGINNLTLAQTASSETLITGVVENTSIPETLGVAMRLQPIADTVVAIVDDTTSGQADLATYYTAAEQIPELTFNDLDTTNMSFEELQAAIRNLPDNTILLLLSLYTDNSGQRINFQQGVDLLIETSSLPIYHPYEHGIGSGLVGGKVVSHFQQGRTAGSMALSILRGVSPSDIDSLYDSPNVFLYDMSVIEAYDLPAYQLPVNTTLLNDHQTFLEKYGIHITSIGFALFIQCVIIFMLYKSNASRAEAEAKLRKSHEDLSHANEELSATNETLVTTNEALIHTYREVEEKNHKIHRLIYKDPLTGMNNRAALTQMIDDTLNRSPRNLNILLFIDIDNFKNINDAYGHDIGDKVIRSAGEKLKELENEHIAIGRFGGDEFVILGTNFVDQPSITAFLDRLQTHFREPVRINSSMFYLSISIGVSIHPYHGSKRSDLLKKADMALYEAKRNGKDRYVIFNDHLLTDIEETLRFQSALRQALDNDELYLNFQPIILAKENRIAGFEALIRWKSDIFGQVSPIRIIENAEEMGLIVELGDYVLRKACAFVCHMNTVSKTPIRVGINVSALQLIFDDFYEKVWHILRETRCKPEMIAFELTESNVLKSIDRTVATLNKLRDDGFRIALDDFGTGYSSLKYFRDLPLSVLKIDRSFSQLIHENVYNQRFVKMVVNIANEKNVHIIIEGIECKEELDTAVALGCHMIQGFYFSRPISEEDAAKLIQNW